MTLNNFYSRCVVFSSVVLVGLGLALLLPWMANTHSQAAQIQLPSQYDAPEAPKTYYVAITGTGSGGLSWTTAFTNVQDALAAVVANDEIWVAEGVYYPDVGGGQSDNALDASFVMTDGVALYGGFRFNDDYFTDRDWVKHLSILSGDIHQDDDTDANGIVTSTAGINGSNSLHVVAARGYLGRLYLMDSPSPPERRMDFP